MIRAEPLASRIPDDAYGMYICKPENRLCTEHFGLKNYALLTEHFAVVVLDNALRTFEEEGLELLLLQFLNCCFLL